MSHKTISSNPFILSSIQMELVKKFSLTQREGGGTASMITNSIVLSIIYPWQNPDVLLTSSWGKWQDKNIWVKSDWTRKVAWDVNAGGLRRNQHHFHGEWYFGWKFEYKLVVVWLHSDLWLFMQEMEDPPWRRGVDKNQSFARFVSSF